jgi:hypothetical protein
MSCRESPPCSVREVGTAAGFLYFAYLLVLDQMKSTSHAKSRDEEASHPTMPALRRPWRSDALPIMVKARLRASSPLMTQNNHAFILKPALSSRFFAPTPIPPEGRREACVLSILNMILPKDLPFKPARQKPRDRRAGRCALAARYSVQTTAFPQIYGCGCEEGLRQPPGMHFYTRDFSIIRIGKNW